MLIYKFLRRFYCFFLVLLVKYRAKSYAGNIFVGGFTIVSKNTNLGCNVSFNGMKILGRGSVNIGDNFHSGVDCMIITEVHNYKGKALPYDREIILKPVLISDNVWLGNRVMILGGVTIGEGAIIQAGSVVSSNIPPLAIAGGNPARAFKFRDEDHYYKLKALGSFH
ncbi:acyltransferase [Shewanella baltica]|uniref:acyltransferase n=1 Tax=Shewanella baltica TaxID=62322 RepID=UPI003D037669